MPLFMWKAWKRSVDFSTLPTGENDDELWKAWKNHRFSHPSHSNRRGTALRAIIIFHLERKERWKELCNTMALDHIASVDVILKMIQEDIFLL